MTYRNDHDATLARVDALQLEVAQLKTDAAIRTVSLPKPPHRRGVAGTAVLGLVTFGLGVVAAEPYIRDKPREEVTTARVATIDTRVDRAALDDCIDTIRPLPNIAAPYVSHAEIAAIEATGAPCRLEIPTFLSAGLWSPDEREALAHWAAAEDTLANTIAMIAVYHGSDAWPDNGATASQLWSEYAHAHEQRDAAIVIWRNTR